MTNGIEALSAASAPSFVGGHINALGGGQAKPVGEVLIMDHKQPAVINMPE